MKEKLFTKKNLLCLAILFVMAVFSELFLTFHIGGTEYTLYFTYIPLTLGAIFLGARGGGLLGLLYGVIIFVRNFFGSSGFDWWMIMQVIPPIVAGIVTGLVFRAVSKRNRLVAVLLAALLYCVLYECLVLLFLNIFFMSISFTVFDSEGFMQQYFINMVIALVITIVFVLIVCIVIAKIKKSKNDRKRKADEERAEIVAGAEDAENEAGAETAAVTADEPEQINSAESQGNQKSSKWKLKLNFGSASFAVAVTFTVLSLLGLVAYIVCMAITTGSAHNGAIPIWAVLIGLIAFAVFGFLAFCIVNFLSSSGIKGTAETVLTVLTFLQYYLLICFVKIMLTVITFTVSFIVSLFVGEFGGRGSPKVWKVNDRGFTRTLEQTGSKAYVNGEWYYQFRDDIGNYWLSKDKRQFYKK